MTPILQSVREKVIKTIPEIMEIQRFCEFVWNNPHPNGGFGGKYTITGIADRVVCFQNEPRRDIEDVVIFNKSDLKGKEFQVVGRPITLEDVLKAIGNMLVVVDAWGNMYKLKMKLSDNLPEFDTTVKPVRWTLGKQLDEQADEVLKFLDEIL